jgi:hypothetical protein
MAQAAKLVESLRAIRIGAPHDLPFGEEATPKESDKKRDRR